MHLFVLLQSGFLQVGDKFMGIIDLPVDVAGTSHLWSKTSNWLEGNKKSSYKM